MVAEEPRESSRRGHRDVDLPGTEFRMAVTDPLGGASRQVADVFRRQVVRQASSEAQSASDFVQDTVRRIHRSSWTRPKSIRLNGASVHA